MAITFEIGEIRNKRGEAQQHINGSLNGGEDNNEQVHEQTRLLAAR